MKKLFLLSIIIFSSLFCQDDEHFLRGNEYMKSCSWNDAFNEYELIDKKTAAVWCNMSLCAEQKGDLFEAYVYALRACKDASFLFDTKLANTIQKGDETYENGATGFIRVLFYFMQKCYAYVDLLVLQLLFLLFWIGICLGINKNNYFRSSVLLTLLFISLIFLGIGIFVKYKNKQMIGLIYQDEATIYVGPHEQYQLLTKIQKGKKVTVCEKRGEWVKIKNNKEVGWIRKDMLAII